MKKENGDQRDRKDRHAYRNEGDRTGKPSDRRRVARADITGAFNLPCKVFVWFAFKEPLTLGYALHWLIPKSHITPMGFLRDGP